MRVYLVHVSTRVDELKQAPMILRDGFSCPAFLFTAVWALWHRLWKQAVMIVVFWFAGGGFLHYLGVANFLYFFAFLGFSLILGYFANDFLSKTLSRRGFELVGLVAAKNSELAFQRWATVTALEKGNAQVGVGHNEGRGC